MRITIHSVMKYLKDEGYEIDYSESMQERRKKLWDFLKSGDKDIFSAYAMMTDKQKESILSSSSISRSRVL